jgi:hypothetical protein
VKVEEEAISQEMSLEAGKYRKTRFFPRVYRKECGPGDTFNLVCIMQFRLVTTRSPVLL